MGKNFFGMFEFSRCRMFVVYYTMKSKYVNKKKEGKETRITTLDMHGKTSTIHIHNI